MRGGIDVLAVVVTFNRQLLLRCTIDALRTQSRPPLSIVVVNNGSTDGTSEWLAAQSNLTIINQQNVGGAGGFSAGIEAAVEMGADWIWCMDDDVAPLPQALERQLTLGQEHGDAVVVCYKGQNGERIEMGNWLCEKTGVKIKMPETGDHQEVNFGHFEGMLIPASVVKKVGLPDQRTFIWGDDIIFGFLASRHGKCILPREPLFEKLAQENDEKTSNCALYFRVRNRLLLFDYLKKYGSLSWSAYFRYIAYLGKLGVFILRYPGNKRLRFELLFNAVKDGLTGNWGKGSFFDISKKISS